MAKYNLVGVDGNAFSVMAYVSKAMRSEHKTQEEIDAYLKDAQSTDYDHLLAVSAEMVMKLNGEDKDRVVRVDWDDDGAGMQEEVTVPGFVPDEDVADYLSDTYGFCVNSWYEI